MKENKYDDKLFFEQYAQMNRSIEGLKGAGEWHVLKELLPDMKNLRVLDLGCGYGWHCKYAVEHGAEKVVGIDLSQKMIQKASEINQDLRIEYRVMAVEDFDFSEQKFDIVLSSLTFHYIESFDAICRNVSSCLNEKGIFIFSVEHPIFTACGTQQWWVNENNEKLHWPVDNYFDEGIRKTEFLGQSVQKYHKTLTTYFNGLLNHGFQISKLIEPQPSSEMLKSLPEMYHELRRPMMLIIKAYKNA